MSNPDDKQSQYVELPVVEVTAQSSEAERQRYLENSLKISKAGANFHGYGGQGYAD